MTPFTLSGNLIDLHARRIVGATLHIADGRIAKITEDGTTYPTYLAPGLVDAHVHVESSMLAPPEFARLAVPHGTVATVSDPHEIANVLGIAGVDYMIATGRTVPFKFHFGAPACVPATPFETAGAKLDADAVASLLARNDIGYLSEVMNFPGVISGDPDMLAKIAAARRLGKRIDGHAPGLRGDALVKYLAAGIETDHECFTLDEATEKLALGCRILIREGSAARNFDALHPLLSSHPDRVHFCTDDMHPDTLLHGHINRLAARAVALGHDLFDVLRAASLNTIDHYRLPVGQLRVGDPADLIELADVKSFDVLRTWIDGSLVADHGRSLLHPPQAPVVNHFHARPHSPADFALPPGNIAHVIRATDGQLITQHLRLPADSPDVLKIAVLNRYEKDAKPAVGFIDGFGLRRGAIASSVAHDSHNIVAVGTSDEALSRAVNLVVEHRGGLAVVDDGFEDILPLPVAGIMTNADGRAVAHQYASLDARVKQMGSTLRAPFMTLSFMALLVIPSLKMSDRGLFDADRFKLIPLFD